MSPEIVLSARVACLRGVLLHHVMKGVAIVKSVIILCHGGHVVVRDSLLTVDVKRIVEWICGGWCGDIWR